MVLQSHYIHNVVTKERSAISSINMTVFEAVTLLLSGGINFAVVTIMKLIFSLTFSSSRFVIYPK